MSPPRPETNDLLRAIVESSDDAIVSKDLNGFVTTWNRAAELMFGWTAGEMIGRSIRTIIPPDRQSEEDEVLASVRSGRKVDHFETIRMTKSGDLIPISLTVSPVYAADGTLIGASKVARDIRERRRLEAVGALKERRDALLAQVTAALTQSLDYEQTLRSIAQAAVPQIADWCAVDVVVEDGSVVRAAVAHVDPAMVPAMERVHAEFSEAGSTSSPERVISDARAAIMPAITDQMLQTAAGEDNAALLFLRSIGFSAYMCVPMSIRGRAVGAMTFTSTVSGRRYDEDDLRLAQEVATRAAFAFENARAYEQVRQANRLKDEFLATLSHEMRTPLNAVLGYVRMIRTRVIAPERLEQALEVVERNASALTQIVEDVLDVSRIVSGKARVELRPISAARVIEDAIATVLPAADAKGVALKADVAACSRFVAADPDRLQQVVWNVLNNAVKFTPAGGEVQVHLGERDSMVEIVVSDTGIGISPEFLPHIFERFRQAEGGTTREHGGLGLGLAIARHLVEMHGGLIQASSEGPGKGATFRIQLPALPVRSPAERGDRLTGSPTTAA